MPVLDVPAFERLLTAICDKLTAECKAGGPFTKSAEFEKRVREALQRPMKDFGISVNFDPHPYVFPDIVLGQFGVEVKFTTNDSWRSVANSVFESTRDSGVSHIYIVYGKMGGKPQVAWGKYEDCVVHVRTSHVPRFEVEINPKKSLFKLMGISYADFSSLSVEERMVHVRKYARGRLKRGERLWWLEDSPDSGHSLPLEVRLYMGLPQEEKRMLRAEAALLCPQIVKGSRSRGKYNDATIYLLTYHGVLCPQARDLFSAGSVALRSNAKRGGNYLLRALQDIQDEMRVAASKLEDGLFVEYWGVSVPPSRRLKEWLKRADRYASGWKPSTELFKI